MERNGTEKIKDLSKEYELLASANAKKVDIIIQKDRDINQLKFKVSVLYRYYMRSGGWSSGYS